MAKIVLVTGGQRSGKSVFAETLTLGLCDRPTYVATARVCDDEFRERIARHRQRRGRNWTTVEEPLHPGSAVENCDTILLDCLTLLATNHFFDCNEDVDSALKAVVAEVEALAGKVRNIIVVTNEVGLGGVSGNAMTRRFTDLLGMVNQRVAALADEVYLTVAGIPVKIK